MGSAYKGLCLTPDEVVKVRQAIAKYTIPEPNSGCLLWERCTVESGYGWLYIGRLQTAAHRLAYAAFVEPVPPMMQVCHRCDVRTCCNVDHLFLGTSEENQNDKGRKHRSWMQIRPEEVLEMREYRRMGLTGRQIADLFGCSTSTVYDITNHVRRPYVTAPGDERLSACSLPEARSRRLAEQTYQSLPPSLKALHDRLRSAAAQGEDQARSDR